MLAHDEKHVRELKETLTLSLFFTGIYFLAKAYNVHNDTVIDLMMTPASWFFVAMACHLLRKTIEAVQTQKVLTTENDFPKWYDTACALLFFCSAILMVLWSVLFLMDLTILVKKGHL